MNAYISPIKLNGIDLYELSFKAYPRQLSGRAELRLDLEDEMEDFAFDDGLTEYHADVTLRIRLAVLDDDGRKSVELMHGMMTLGVRLTMRAESDEDAIRRTLRTNGVSMGYAHARSKFASLTEDSPFGKILLPPIDLQAYLHR